MVQAWFYKVGELKSKGFIKNMGDFTNFEIDNKQRHKEENTKFI